MEQLLPRVMQRLRDDSTRHAMISAGGQERSKDEYHHDAMVRLLGQHAVAVLRRGTGLYPEFSQFHHGLAGLLAPSDTAATDV